MKKGPELVQYQYIVFADQNNVFLLRFPVAEPADLSFCRFHLAADQTLIGLQPYHIGPSGAKPRLASPMKWHGEVLS